jgi:hypothetical protein
VSVAVILRLRDIAVPATTAERAAERRRHRRRRGTLAGAEDSARSAAGPTPLDRLVARPPRGLLRRAVAAWTRQGSIWGRDLMLGVGALGMLLGGAGCCSAVA